MLYTRTWYLWVLDWAPATCQVFITDILWQFCRRRFSCSRVWKRPSSIYSTLVSNLRSCASLADLRKIVYALNSLIKWNIRRNSTSVQISHTMKERLVSWHKNVLWQLRIRIWERSLTLWNKSKCVTCDFVKMSLSTYFTHVTFFNQKLNRYMLIANTNTAIKLFTRSYIYIYLIYFLNMMLLRKYNEYRFLYHLRLRRVFGPLRSS